MADLETFRKKIRRYYRKRYHQDGKTKYTQQDLAALIPMNEDELGKRLNGYRDEKTGRVWQLTEENVLDIVLRLAELQALNWEQAVELLDLMDYPLDTLQWKTKLQKHLSPPNLAQSPMQKRTPPAVVPDTPEGSQQLQSGRRRLFQAPNLPRGYVPRPKAFNEIKHLLLNHQENQTTAITTALRGAGGFGKTTLALALCHDPEIQAAFPDGILWVMLGEHPSSPLDVLNGVLASLEPSLSDALTLEKARDRWRTMLDGHAYLLVIDDVWQAEALLPLLESGPQCRRLVTTRNDVLVPKDAARVPVDAMEREEAIAVLCQDLPEEISQATYRTKLEALVARLGYWPLLLTLANGMLTDLVVEYHLSIAEALTTIAEAYQTRGVTAFRLDNTDERQRTVDACLRVSVQHLENFTHPHYHARERYQELAVFPEDTDIPLATLQIYWKGSAGLEPWETKELCTRLHRLSLLLSCDLGKGMIRLHDVLRNYLIQRAGSDLPALHAHLLDVSQQVLGVTRWADLPRSETYLWQHLIFHLCQADRFDTLKNTLTDLHYLLNKALYIGLADLKDDLLLACTQEQADGIAPELSLFASLDRTMIRINHLLPRVHTLSERGGLLLSHLESQSLFATQRTVLELELPRPFLMAWHPLPSGVSIIRTLVTCCAVSPDGRFIVFASPDMTLKVWDTATRVKRLTLSGYMGPVMGCAVSPDGTWIVSASTDTTLKVWDATTGAERFTLSGHTESVEGCAVSPDGQWIVSASSDKTLKVWDTATGVERLTLSGHTESVEGCAVSPDGQWVVSASSDETLKVWEAATGAELHTLSGHMGPVLGCAVSPDGQWIVSASDDCTLKVWDATTGAERFTLSGHTHWVWGCAVSPDGDFIVSASADQTLKVWDAASGACLLTFPVDEELYACAFHPDGEHLVACGESGMFLLWLIR